MKAFLLTKKEIMDRALAQYPSPHLPSCCDAFMTFEEFERLVIGLAETGELRTHDYGNGLRAVFFRDDESIVSPRVVHLRRKR